MKKILFVYDHDKPENLAYDGLWCALTLLEKEFEIQRLNIKGNIELVYDPLLNGQDAFDFGLGWGAFDSAVDKWLQKHLAPIIKKGLCLPAQFPVNETAKNYNVIFYETNAVCKWLYTEGLQNLVHAFGINTDVFKPMNYPKVWDYITVGSFIKWHRYDKLLDKKGFNLVVGEIATSNIQEAFNYVANGVLHGWTVSNYVPAPVLATFYNMSKKAYLPADFGQERAVLEARSCGLPVEVEPDNPKLTELLTTPIWDVPYYADQLRKGITSC